MGRKIYPSQRRYMENNPAITFRMEKEKKEYNHGFQNAKRAYRIWNFCNGCGKAIDILPNSDAHTAIVDYLKKGRWGHPECH